MQAPASRPLPRTILSKTPAMSRFTFLRLLGAMAACSLLAPLSLSAAGMTPETTVVLVDVENGEGTFTLTNTDERPLLLFTELQPLADDPGELLIVTPPLARVEPGERQLLRFIVQADQPITTQRLQRVSFEGIAQDTAGGKSKIDIGIRHNLPVLIHPPGLTKIDRPWALLKWSARGTSLSVQNDSPYVVRLDQQLNIVPDGIDARLPETYLLPGASKNMPLSRAVQPGAQVRLYPAGLYGYQGAVYDAPLTVQ